MRISDWSSDVCSSDLLSIPLILIAQSMGLPPLYYAAAVALALMIALGFASIAKACLLARILKAPVHSLRWPLVWATAAAEVLVWGATQLPDWAERSEEHTSELPSLMRIFSAAFCF